MKQLNISDYKSILDFYDIDYVHYDKSKIISQAHDILVNKLCRCINNIKTNDINKSVGICNKSVMIRKGIIPNKFKCKKKAKFLFNKTKKLSKKYNNLTIKNKR